MTLFWILAAAMVVAAVALLAPTLLKHQRADRDYTEGLNVEIARDRLAELQKAKDAGDLSDEEFAQGRRDLELALAQDLDGTGAHQPATVGGGRGALIASALLIPIITISVYLQIGSPQLIANPPGSQIAAGHGGQGLPPIEDLAEQLRQRMEENPDNAEGWFLLGRTYMRLENYPEAVKAYEQVVRLMPDEPAGLLSLADAMIMSNDMQTSGSALALLEKALRIDPENVTALWLLGNAAADRGDTARALHYWEQAYPLLAIEPQMQFQLGQRITAAGGELPATPTVADLPPIMSPSAPPASTPPATDSSASEGGIRVQVALAPELIAQTDPNDTVFVLARAESGPPMPLAVARHRVAELPLDVRLTDAMAMMPAMKLSAFPRVKVTAKVSKSGQAATQSGDLLAADQIVDSGSPPDSVQLLINQVAE